MKVFLAALALAFSILGAYEWPFYFILVGYLSFVYYRHGKQIFKQCLTFTLIGLSIIGVNYLLSLYIPSSQIGFVTKVSDNYFLVRTLTRTIHVRASSHTYAIGDILRLDGEVSALQGDYIDSKFSFHNYLLSQGASATLNNPFTTLIYKAKWRPSTYINDFLSKWPSHSASVIGSLLFSLRDDSSIFANSSTLGVMFLLSASGVYLTSFIKILERMLSIKYSNQTSRIIALVILFPLWLFNPSKFAFYRIYSKNIVRIIQNKRGFPVDELSLNGSLIIAFLLLKPSLILNSAFYLGFGISILMAFMQGTLRRYGKIKQKLYTSLLIYVLILPLNINATYKLSLFGPLIQFILRPLGVIIFTFAYISFLLNFVFSPIYPFIWAINWIITTLSQLDFYLDFAPLPKLIMYIYYSLYLVVIYSWEIKLLPLQNNGVFALASILLLNLLPVRNTFTEAVYFINVGQGDAILFRSKDVGVLIDTGGSKYFDISEEVILPFLIKHKINYLHSVIITHNDFDHSGALPNILRANPNSKLITSSGDFPYTVGDLTFYNLNNQSALSLDNNDSSLVLYCEFMNKRWLLMGDASIKVEEEIIKSYPTLSVDYLKVGHHGSNTSTSSEFINQIKPKEAIISVGLNYYGHPHQEVINTLIDANVKIRRTDIESTIAYYSFAL